MLTMQHQLNTAAKGGRPYANDAAPTEHCCKRREGLMLTMQHQLSTAEKGGRALC
jgi:hypothetical protein